MNLAWKGKHCMISCICGLSMFIQIERRATYGDENLNSRYSDSRDKEDCELKIVCATLLDSLTNNPRERQKAEGGTKKNRGDRER